MQKIHRRKEWQKPTNELIENFPSVYQFCNGDLINWFCYYENAFILMNIWITGKNLMKPHYHLKKFL